MLVLPQVGINRVREGRLPSRTRLNDWLGVARVVSSEPIELRSNGNEVPPKRLCSSGIPMSVPIVSNGGKGAMELSQRVKHYCLPLEMVIGRSQRNACYGKARYG